MNTGFGFSEILLIVTIIVVFFGSKQLPVFLREIAKLTAKVRRYSDRVRRELDDVTRSIEPQPVPFAEQQAKKKELRRIYLSARKKLTSEQRSGKSAEIGRHFLELDVVRNATMIMLYVEMGAEVLTRPLIRELFGFGKRIVLPYVIEGSRELGIAEIHDIDSDIETGGHNVPEPLKALRKTFFKSDLETIVCPGVAFDSQGGRLGRGMGYYDSFLHELRGRIPLIGLAYQCQMLDESLPFEYHDVSMDKVITENGVVVGGSPLPSDSTAESASSPAG